MQTQYLQMLRQSTGKGKAKYASLTICNSHTSKSMADVSGCLGCKLKFYILPSISLSLHIVLAEWLICKDLHFSLCSDQRNLHLSSFQNLDILILGCQNILGQRGCNLQIRTFHLRGFEVDMMQA